MRNALTACQLTALCAVSRGVFYTFLQMAPLSEPAARCGL